VGDPQSQQMMDAVIFTTSHSHRVTVDKSLILSDPRVPPPFPLLSLAPQPSPLLPILPRHRIGIAENFSQRRQPPHHASLLPASHKCLCFCLNLNSLHWCSCFGEVLSKGYVTPPSSLFLCDCPDPVSYLAISSPVSAEVFLSGEVLLQKVSFSCVPISSLNPRY